MYPQLTIDLPLLRSNLDAVISRCHRAGITVAGVTKGVNSLPKIVDTYVAAGSDQIGSSRVSQLRKIKESHPDKETLLLRVPMMCELDDAARWCDVSLHSDLSVLRAFNAACAKAGVKRKVILMADLGDLREGWWDKEEMADAGLTVETEMNNLVLAGVGTNLGCYGALIPTTEKMNDLITIAEKVESKIGRKLEYISGGATSSFRLVHLGQMPERINHLRIGEGILLNYDMLHDWGMTDMDYASDHVFTLTAQVLECREKPSYPQGEIFIDAFGNYPVYEDEGIRTKALLGLGKLDVGDFSRIFPKEKGIRVMGGASDHCIIDVTDCARTLKAGDTVDFDIAYSQMLYLTENADVEIQYKE